jgi:hypothetical protein
MPVTAKAPARLWCKKVTERKYEVECRSKQHAYHTVVRSSNNHAWICDRACWKFNKDYTCPHTERVEEELRGGQPVVKSLTPYELFDGDDGDAAPVTSVTYHFRQKTTLESLFKDA